MEFTFKMGVISMIDQFYMNINLVSVTEYIRIFKSGFVKLIISVLYTLHKNAHKHIFKTGASCSIRERFFFLFRRDVIQVLIKRSWTLSDMCAYPRLRSSCGACAGCTG